MNIEKDWRPTIWAAIWGAFLAWIPTAVVAIRTATNEVTYTGTNLAWKRGLITKHTENIDLRRARSVSVTDGFFTGGQLRITTTDNNLVVIPYIKNPADVARRLRESLPDNATWVVQ